jgi:hypothetical protein
MLAAEEGAASRATAVAEIEAELAVLRAKAFARLRPLFKPERLWCVWAAALPFTDWLAVATCGAWSWMTPR